MALGTYLLENAANAAYTPTVDATHYKDGKFYKQDANGNMVETTPYTQPSTFQRILSPTADRYADLNAQYTASPLLAQQSEANRMFTPTYANTQTQAKAFGDTGAPATIGGLQGQSDIATAKSNLIGATSELQRQPVTQASIDQETVNRLHQATNADPLIIQHSINQLRGTLQRDPTEQEILNTIQQTQQIQTSAEKAAAPYNANALVGQAKLGAQRTGLEQELYPYEDVTKRANAVTGAYESEHPEIHAPSIFTGEVNPNDMTITPGVLPLQSRLMEQIADRTNQTSPTNISIGGKNINLPPPDYGNGAIDPLMREHINDLHEAKGDADQATMKARKAAIDAEDRQQRYNHLIGKLNVGELPHGTGYIIGQTLKGMAKSPGTLTGGLYRTGQLIGSGTRWLGHEISGE